MKKFFTLIFLYAFLEFAAAQQPAQYSLYMLNKFNFNPAYAGFDNSLSLTGVFRKQWVGIPESPVIQDINVHLPLYVFSSGVGLQLENETLGGWQKTKVMLAYDYQLAVGSAGLLSLGLSGGILQYTLDGSKIRTPEGFYDENEHDHRDPNLPLGKETGTSPAFNFGAFYQGEKIEIGLSTLNLTEQAIDLTGLYFKPERSYFFYLGYQFDISPSLSLNPSALVKSNITQTQTDLSVIAKYNENVFGGATIRGYHSNSIDALAILAGFNFNEKFTIAYSYDLTLSSLNIASNGSHEILLNFNLGKPIGKGKPPKIIYNPRFL